jgi:hypothetical protein
MFAVPTVLVAFITTLLVFILLEIRRLRPLADTFKFRDTLFPVFSRAEIIATQKQYEHWRRVEEKLNLLGTDLLLSEEERQILMSIRTETLKGFEVVGDVVLEGRVTLSPTALRVLSALAAQYWKETYLQRLARMLEANIAVLNGAEWRNWARDPQPVAEAPAWNTQATMKETEKGPQRWETVLTVAERLQFHKEWHHWGL